MTLDEYRNLSDTDKAFLKLEGCCDGCGCKLKNEMFIMHAEWCAKRPEFIWRNADLSPRKNSAGWHSGEQKMASLRRQGKSVFANMVNELNKIFRNEHENTNR
jgi:hypothetical protein